MEPKFNGVYLRNNLPKIKDGAYVKNLDEFKSIGNHWIALYVNGNKIIYIDCFRVEHTTKKKISCKKSLKNQKYLITNIHRIQAYHLPRI